MLQFLICSVPHINVSVFHSANNDLVPAKCLCTALGEHAHASVYTYVPACTLCALLVNVSVVCAYGVCLCVLSWVHLFGGG